MVDRPSDPLRVNRKGGTELGRRPRHAVGVLGRGLAHHRLDVAPVSDLHASYGNAQIRLTADGLLVLRQRARPRSAQQRQHQDLDVLIIARVDFVQGISPGEGEANGQTIRCA